MIIAFTSISRSPSPSCQIRGEPQQTLRGNTEAPGLVESVGWKRRVNIRLRNMVEEGEIAMAWCMMRRSSGEDMKGKESTTQRSGREVGAEVRNGRLANSRNVADEIGSGERRTKVDMRTEIETEAAEGVLKTIIIGQKELNQEQINKHLLAFDLMPETFYQTSQSAPQSPLTVRLLLLPSPVVLQGRNLAVSSTI